MSFGHSYQFACLLYNGVSQPFLEPETSLVEADFPTDPKVSGWLKHMTLTVHLISALVTSAALRASGVRSRRLRTPPQSIRRQIPDAADPTSDHQASDPRGCGPLLYEDVNFCPILFFPKFTLANTDSMPEFHFLFHRFLYVYIGKPIDCPLWFLSLFLSADHPLLETC